MCGIAGFSLSPNEQVNAKKLAKAMLLSIESRGKDATGFAFIDPTGAIQVHKQDMAASEFVKRRLCVPRDLSTVIMHTRFATQGDPKWNENNHPILTGGVVGVHNGHVSNDWSLFMDIKEQLGQDVRIGWVDSEAIFASLAYTMPNDGDPRTVLEKIKGGAAVAWLDEDDEVRNRLHLARISTSPLVLGETAGGSVLFASTQEAVREGAAAVGLILKMVRHISEGKYITVVEGTYDDVRTFDVPKSYNYSSSKGWSGQGRSVVRYGAHDLDAYAWDSEDYDLATAGTYILGPQGGSRLDGRLAAEDPDTDLDVSDNADLLDEIDEALALNEREAYMEWWRQNTQALDNAIRKDEVAERKAKHDREKLFDEFIHAPRLNGFYLGHAEIPFKPQSDSEYLADPRNAKREESIEKWCASLKTASDEGRAQILANMRIGVRPGDMVTTELDGIEVYATIHAVPETFPGGFYVLRAFLRNKGRQGGAEAIFIARRYYEFDLYTGPETEADVAEVAFASDVAEVAFASDDDSTLLSSIDR